MTDICGDFSLKLHKTMLPWQIEFQSSVKTNRVTLYMDIAYFSNRFSNRLEFSKMLHSDNSFSYECLIS